MKGHIRELLEKAINTLKSVNLIPQEAAPQINVEQTKDKLHGDFANNLALILAKSAKKNPRELAELIINHLPSSPLISKTEIAGPGFINFFVSQDFLKNQIESLYASDNLGFKSTALPQTIVIDYSSPNLAKEMHVGHLRSSVIGDAMVRVLTFQGHHVVKQNHVGDWGTQFGMLLAYMEELKTDHNSIENDLSNLEVFYRNAKQRFDECELFANRARKLVVELQSGDEKCLILWKQFSEISLSHCQDIYNTLGVSLTRDDAKGESAYNDDLAKVVDDLDQLGLLKESQGAKCVFLDRFKNKEGEPLPVIVEKKGSGFLYATSDLAALRYRQNKLNANRIIYFVDARQSLHFQQIFELARLAKFVLPETRLEHMPFGTVMGDDGKPFKTRSGKVAKLADLLSESKKRAYKLVKEKNPEMDEKTLLYISSVVGISSVKYADLSKNRTSDYVFNFDKMLSFTGNTAPYLLYAYTRVIAIFRKAGITIDQVEGEIELTEEREIDLANKLLKFNGIVESVSKRGMPSLLCTYLFELAGIFSSFYEACPILTSDTMIEKNSRLKLAALTAKTLSKGLSLLGIKTLEKM